VTREVVFRPEAETEVLDVQQWYASRRDGLGEEFGNAVDAAVGRIAENSLAFPRVHGETRRAVLTRFPYAVYFRIASDRLVVVLAVHGRQDPSRWQKRK
jgi:plasmid stabilization system protein ParE